MQTFDHRFQNANAILQLLPVSAFAIQFRSQIPNDELHRLHCRVITRCLPGSAGEEVRQYSRCETAGSRDDTHEKLGAHATLLSCAP